MTESTTQGFIGLGAMGKPMASNAFRHLANRGEDLIVHDIAGTSDRAPQGAIIAQSNVEVVRRAKVIALSLPSVAVNRAVIEEIAASGHQGKIIVDTCTIGPEAAAENAPYFRRRRHSLRRCADLRHGYSSARGHIDQHGGRGLERNRTSPIAH